MLIEQEIVKAIGTHAKWKVRLHYAIESGNVDHDIANVSRDDVCAFGQWLSGPTISKTARASADFLKVADLHTKFHECAGRVIKLILQNRKSAAAALLSGEYTQVSSQLVSAIIGWKQSIEQGHTDG